MDDAEREREGGRTRKKTSSRREGGRGGESSDLAHKFILPPDRPTAAVVKNFMEVIHGALPSGMLAGLFKHAVSVHTAEGGRI